MDSLCSVGPGKWLQKKLQRRKVGKEKEERGRKTKERKGEEGEGKQGKSRTSEKYWSFWFIWLPFQCNLKCLSVLLATLCPKVFPVGLLAVNRFCLFVAWFSGVGGFLVAFVPIGQIVCFHLNQKQKSRD